MNRCHSVPLDESSLLYKSISDQMLLLSGTNPFLFLAVISLQL